MIILCMPVHQYRGALNNIGPYINKEKNEVFIGTIYDKAGFNWMVHDIEKAFSLSNLIIFRTITYGHRVANYGGNRLISLLFILERNLIESMKFFSRIYL